jgi:ArsR family transcriptional regulator
MPKKPKCLCAGKDLAHISNLLKTISESNRLKIICLLNQGELCVCEIMDALNLPNNLTSHHLKVLTKAKILVKRKEGRFTFFKINKSEFSLFKKEFNRLVGR